MKHYKTNAQLSADARHSLLGHISTAVWSLLLYTVLNFFLEQIAGSLTFGNQILDLAILLCARFITVLFGSLFGIGLDAVFLKLQYEQPASFRDLFICFRGNADRAVKARSFVTLGEVICLLPMQILAYLTPDSEILARLPVLLITCAVCIAAYIAWSLTYAMVNYLLLDFPEMESGKILRAARTMMRGNRIRLFLLLFRLVPMHLLGIFSFGVANLYAGSCQHACSAAFYKDIMEQHAR